MSGINHKLIEEVIRFVPPLASSLHKGQAGRVGVMGGSRDYTGAPYYSSFSAMRLGADLAHVICEPSAAAVIKTYSPDLIVHGLLSLIAGETSTKKELGSLVQDRLHVLVVGPGLGRDEHMLNWAEWAIGKVKEKGGWLVVDADGLWLIQRKPDIIHGYRRAILTPNPVEFTRLLKACSVDPDSSSSDSDLASKLSEALGGVTILQKGATDIITNGKEVLRGEAQGGLKRCGGQGDVLSGVLGTLLAWAGVYEGANSETDEDRIPSERLPLLAAYAGSCVTRMCARRAFKEQGRAMQTSDMLPMVGKVYKELFESEEEREQKAKI